MDHDSANTVCLILRNSIDDRITYRNESKNESKNEMLNIDEMMIFELISMNSKISQKILAEKTGFSRSKIQRLLKKLQDKNVIYRQGPRKGGAWKILDKNYNHERGKLQ